MLYPNVAQSAVAGVIRRSNKKRPIPKADVVVTMGCGDTCPYVPGRRYEDWELPDPAGQPLDAVRPIRDEIEQRVRQLLAELGVPPQIY